MRAVALWQRRQGQCARVASDADPYLENLLARLLHSSEAHLLEIALTGPRPQDESSRRPIDRTYPADAVPATPGVADHGAHVGEDRRRSPRTNPGTLAQVSAGKGTTMWLSIAGIAVVLILLAIMFF